MQVAVNAEMRSIFCTYGFGRKQGLSSDYEISDIREVLEIV